MGGLGSRGWTALDDRGGALRLGRLAGGGGYEPGVSHQAHPTGRLQHCAHPASPRAHPLTGAQRPSPTLAQARQTLSIDGATRPQSLLWPPTGPPAAQRPCQRPPGTGRQAGRARDWPATLLRCWTRTPPCTLSH